MANESFFGRMAALPGKRLDDFLEQTERYQRGEINLGSQMLQGGANALGMLTDIPLQAAGEAVSAVIPEVVKKGLQDVSENIMETEAVQSKALQGVLKLDIEVLLRLKIKLLILLLLHSRQYFLGNQ